MPPHISPAPGISGKHRGFCIHVTKPGTVCVFGTLQKCCKSSTKVSSWQAQRLVLLEGLLKTIETRVLRNCGRFRKPMLTSLRVTCAALRTSWDRFFRCKRNTFEDEIAKARDALVLGRQGIVKISITLVVQPSGDFVRSGSLSPARPAHVHFPCIVRAGSPVRLILPMQPASCTSDRFRTQCTS